MMQDSIDAAFQRKLKKEMEQWRADGLLTEEQRERILARYRHIEEIEQKAGSGRMIQTISILGSILVGVGVLLFIAANWSEIPRIAKLGIIFVSLLTSHGLGYWLRYEKKNFPRVGASLILLGSILFGAGIFLIAQIYNITVHYPNGPLLWGLGILPLAYLLRFRSVLLLSLLALSLWLGMEASFHVSDLFQYVPVIVLYWTAGMAVWVLGLAHEGSASFRELSGPYVLVGLLMTYAGTFLLTFDTRQENLGTPELMPFYLGILVLFAAAAAVTTLKGSRDAGWRAELAALATLTAGLCLLAATSPGVATGPGFLSPRLLFNLLFAAGIIGLICLGYIRRRPLYINIGLVFFVLDVVARYVDFFWKLLPRSLFFIAGGCILLAGGLFLERKRRVVLESFRVKEEIP
ncbi:MAG: DUF2157 domain-containing protein [Syntrophaceae bacterium]|nr:DUF2157 domain-containing protein [Syntrophaceae bacterium]